MGKTKTWYRRWGVRGWLLFLVLTYAIAGTALRLMVPPPAAVGLEWPLREAMSVEFFQDKSWLDSQAQRQLEQSVFDALFQMIDNAERLLVIDMFLFNSWQGPVAETHRPLAAELTDRLIARKRTVPEMTIVLISDPINTVYGGLESPHLSRLSEAGIDVFITPLERLQDSNPTWSGLWRLIFAPFGNSPGTLLPNPFGAGRVSLRSYLALFNFKANHRKLLVGDDGNTTLSAMVSSANPHDGSSAHRNVALRFAGDAANDLLAGELALLELAQAHELIALVEHALQDIMTSASAENSAENAMASTSTKTTSTRLQVLSESRIHEAVLSLLKRSGSGDAVDLAMFYLSDRHIIKQLIEARRRGATVRVVLDVNNDAFGRTKNGVPNRPVAAELVDAGVSVRWCATDGEQCHAKWLHVRSGEAHTFLLGSANYTRRNLHDFNLETNVLVQAVAEEPVVIEMLSYFDEQWENAEGRTYSLAYDEFSNESVWLKLQYRFMEFTGLSTF